jgi:hypothetical protein
MKGQLSSTAVLKVGVLTFFMAFSVVFAHHSPSVFDQTKSITVTGTVTKFDFANPHVVVYFDVKGTNGKVEQWIATGGPPNHMVREGWSRSFIKPGEELTITGYPYKDGRKIMHLQVVKRTASREVIRSREAP